MMEIENSIRHKELSTIHTWGHGSTCIQIYVDKNMYTQRRQMYVNITQMASNT